MTVDKVFQSFLEAQYSEGMVLAEESDLLDLAPVGPPQPSAYLVTLYCKGLVKNDKQEVSIGSRFRVGIMFPPDYLRRANPFQILHWLTPNAFHPNIRYPAICIGRLYPGTPLVDLLYRIFDVVSGKMITVREDDALCQQGCVFARNHPEMFPVDPRPLKRRRINLKAEPVAVTATRPAETAASQQAESQPDQHEDRAALDKARTEQDHDQAHQNEGRADQSDSHRGESQGQAQLSKGLAEQEKIRGKCR